MNNKEAIEIIQRIVYDYGNPDLMEPEELYAVIALNKALTILEKAVKEV